MIAQVESEDTPAVPGEHLGQLDDELVVLALDEAMHQDDTRARIAFAVPACHQGSPIQAWERGPGERVVVLLGSEERGPHAERVGVLGNRLEELEDLRPRPWLDRDPVRRKRLGHGHATSPRSAGTDGQGRYEGEQDEEQELPRFAHGEPPGCRWRESSRDVSTRPTIPQEREVTAERPCQCGLEMLECLAGAAPDDERRHATG